MVELGQNFTFLHVISVRSINPCCNFFQCLCCVIHTAVFGCLILDVRGVPPPTLVGEWAVVFFYGREQSESSPHELAFEAELRPRFISSQCLISLTT